MITILHSPYAESPLLKDYLMLTYFATIAIKPEHFEEAIVAVQNIVARTRQEKGCHQFDLYADATKNQLFIMEKWDDQAALDFHYAQDYTRAVFASYEDWLVTAPHLQPLTQRA